MDVKELRAMGFHKHDMRQYDADKDGKLSKAEFTLMQQSYNDMNSHKEEASKEKDNEKPNVEQWPLRGGSRRREP